MHFKVGGDQGAFRTVGTILAADHIGDKLFTESQNRVYFELDSRCFKLV